MTLAAGSRLGAHEIVSLIGAGGMGEVYRAFDTKLARQVALKILPESVARDPDRIARFQREAHILASLNHPHIATIHGFEESGATRYLVLELVDGETLADRLRAGPLPFAEAVIIARQITDALAAAHEKGIIHRDLKPANIALTAAGAVKVLDFGLARALAADEGADPALSPTLTFHATQAGVILGTAAYMSPEQAKGRSADKASDVWAFGCVLFEMLVGRRAFEGDDVSDTLAAVLRGEPDWGALPDTVPDDVRTLIVNCVRRDRQQRIADIAVVRYVLDTLRPAGASAKAETLATRTKRSPTTMLFATVAVGAAAAAAAWFLKPTSTVRPSPVSRFGIPLGPDLAFNGAATSRHLFAVSPDGRYLVYEANAQLYLRALDQLDAAPIRGTNELPFEPFFSPDGQSVAYFTGSGQLKRIGIGGGSPVTICNAQPPFGASWSGDSIFFGQLGTGIYEVAATGGTPRVVLANDPRQYEVFHGPQLLPDGKTLLFTSGSPTTLADRWTSGRIEALSLATGKRKVLLRAGTDGHYVPTGHLIYGREGVVYAIAFDLATLETKGSAVPIIQGVAQAGGSTTGAMQASVSNSGVLVYLPFTAGSLTTMVWRDRQGRETPIAAPPHVYQTPRVSPDGTRIAVHAADQDNDIWIWDVAKETLTRLTFDKGVDSSPVWSRDLTRIFYASAKDGPLNLFWKPSNGTGRPEALFATAPETNSALVANGTSPDGRMLVYSAGVPADVLAVPIDGDHKAVPLMAQRQFAERGGDVSPDGRWIAYYSDESGGFQVYVRPFPAVDQGRWQISGDGGTVPRFAPDGRELLYVNGQNQLVSTAVTSGPTFSFGKTSVVMDLSDTPPTVYRNYDVAPDGRIILIRQPQRTRAPQQFVAVLNWFTELKERVPSAR